MKKIKIITVPPGEAPDWVRQEWVGLELPLAENTPPIGTQHDIGILGGKIPENEKDGYPVETITTIEILKEKSPEAAAWWTAWWEENFL